VKLLLDTHTFIWWDSEPERLSTQALAHCQDARHQLFLSVASLWKMAIKQQLGKLRLRLPLGEIVAHQETTNGLLLLPVEAVHVLHLGELPNHHKDPFDRLLVSQALAEGAVLVTVDSAIRQYPVGTIW
jgi:PIN domain nuclease of toxin-antitoxin system